MRTTRIIAVAAVVVLVALVASAVTLAATGSSPTEVAAASVAVGPGPPRTATGVLTYSSSSGITITADCAFDFEKGAADVTATASLSIVTATVEARLATDTFYLHVPQFASLVGAPWVSTGELGGPTRLDALATAMRRPDLSRLHAKRRVSVRRVGGATTTLSFGLVHLPSTAGLPISLPGTAAVTAAVMTGDQGQLLAVGRGAREPRRGPTRWPSASRATTSPSTSPPPGRATWSCSARRRSGRSSARTPRASTGRWPGCAACSAARR